MRGRYSISWTHSGGRSSTPPRPTSTRPAPTAVSTSAGSPRIRRPGSATFWHVRVRPADGDSWVQEFGLHTPSEAVAGFLAALVTNSSC
ncbi:DUF317 domain-containing protein [Streptomyces sp. KO7888]|uniref:DUF317 domain-containing protein n=1 Tax=Streptomyces sp. KO7888 TaxID=2602737 RepID=UPI001F6206E1|nr:DUF317 domain-containing protein [Streptomyces sp. KO7888]